jgi:hypothetical protein
MMVDLEMAEHRSGQHEIAIIRNIPAMIRQHKTGGFADG